MKIAETTSEPAEMIDFRSDDSSIDEPKIENSGKEYLVPVRSQQTLHYLWVRNFTVGQEYSRESVYKVFCQVLENFQDKDKIFNIITELFQKKSSNRRIQAHKLSKLPRIGSRFYIFHVI